MMPMSLGLGLGLVQGGGIPFSPAQAFAAGVAGVWFDPSDLTTVYSDTAGTTLISGADNPVGAIKSKGSLTILAAAPNDAARPMLRNSGSVWWIEFDGVDDTLRGLFGVTYSQPTTSWTAIRTVPTFSALQYYFANGSASQRQVLYTTTAAQLTLSAVDGSLSGTNQIVEASRDYVVSGLFNTTSSRFQVDDDVALIGNVGTRTANAVSLGALYVPVVYSAFRFYGHVFVLGNHEAAYGSQMRSWLASKQGRSLTPAMDRIIVLGDSTVAERNPVTEPALSTLFSASGYTNVSLADSSDTIVQQQTLWNAHGGKWRARAVLLQIGQNDMDPTEAASVAIARYQTLVNTVRASVQSGCAILGVTLTPQRANLINVYGATNGPIAYQKWLDFNAAITNGTVTGLTAVVSAHTALLNDGSGNLAVAYDTGDGIHPNLAGRNINVDDGYVPSLVALGIPAVSI